MLFVCLCFLSQEDIVLLQKWGLADGLFLVLSVVVDKQIYHYQIRSRVIYVDLIHHTLKDTGNFLRCCFQRSLLKTCKHKHKLTQA